MAGASVPRTYHSVSLLLPDARIFNGGGGLCGIGCPCAAGRVAHVTALPCARADDNTVVMSFVRPALRRPQSRACVSCPQSESPRRSDLHPGAVPSPTAKPLSVCPCRRQNHPDGQIYTPPYLLNPDGSPAARPNITSAPPSTAPGAMIYAATDRNVTAFSLIRVRSCPVPCVICKHLVGSQLTSLVISSHQASSCASSVALPLKALPNGGTKICAFPCPEEWHRQHVTLRRCHLAREHLHRS